VNLYAVVVKGHVANLTVGSQSDQSRVLQVAQHVEDLLFLRVALPLQEKSLENLT
jgi:hypothetical protein